MSTEHLLLALRIVTSLVLVSFLGLIFVVLWRDYRMAAGTAGERQQRRGRLVVLDGNGATGAGASYPLLPLTSLGRGPTNTVVLQDTFCSQQHALVIWRGGQWWLEDQHSSNGTLLNGEPVHEPVVVSSGDVIHVGRVSLKLELD